MKKPLMLVWGAMSAMAAVGMDDSLADTVVYGTIRTAEKDNPIVEAIEVTGGKATLDVVVSRAPSLGKSVEWTPVSTNKVEVSAPSEQGFFIVAPALSSLD